MECIGAKQASSPSARKHGSLLQGGIGLAAQRELILSSQDPASQRLGPATMTVHRDVNATEGTQHTTQLQACRKELN